MRIIAGALVLVAFGASCGDDSGSDQTSSAARVVEVIATEFAFNGDPGTILAGDTIEFQVANAGQIDHSMEVLSSDGRSLGKTDRLVPGATEQIAVTFEEAGEYRLVCDIDDHMSRGQVAGLSVGDR